MVIWFFFLIKKIQLELYCFTVLGPTEFWLPMILVQFRFVFSIFEVRVFNMMFLVRVQINVADIDPVTGQFTKSFSSYAVSGFIRGHVSLIIIFCAMTIYFTSFSLRVMRL
jgi:hypothetical protein